MADLLGGRNYELRSPLRREDAKWQTGNRLASRVDPAIRRVEHRQHRAALGRLANLTRSGEQLRLAPAEPMDSDEHEFAIERLDDLRALERDRVVRQQIIETGDRRARRRLHAIARRIGPDLLGLRLPLAEPELHPHLHALRPLRRTHLE